MTPTPFRGAKIVLLHQGQLIAYQRDQKPEIPFPGMWDLPGGGREHDESPQECAIRETREEFDITINPEWIVWEQYYPALIANDPGSYFLVAKLENGFGTIRFSDEGQQWAAMSVEDFLVSVQEWRACAGLSEGRQSDSLYFATNTERSNGLDTLHPASP